jgi:hypothetical protein
MASILAPVFSGTKHVEEDGPQMYLLKGSSVVESC